MGLSFRNGLVNFLNFVSLVVIFFLGGRILLKLVAANVNTPFVAWINSVSSFLIYPFNGIYPNQSLNGGSVLDIVAVVALITYLIVISVISYLIDSAFVASTHRIERGHTI